MDWKEQKGLMILVIIVIAFLAWLLVMGTGNLILGDERVFMALNPGVGNPTPFDMFFIYFSSWGPGEFGLGTYLFILFAFVLFGLSLKFTSLKPMRFIFILIIVGLIIGYLGITTVVKDIVQRDRPFTIPELLSNADYWVPLYYSGSTPLQIFGGESFPSGHATAAFIFATPFMLIYKKYWIQISAAAYGVLMGFARVFLGVHFPLDVFVGSLIGILTIYVFYLGLKKYFLPKSPWFQYEDTK
jgi:undecaprenyl-diphosphatase